MGECYCSECNTAADYDPEEEMEEKTKSQAKRIEELKRQIENEAQLRDAKILENRELGDVLRAANAELKKKNTALRAAAREYIEAHKLMRVRFNDAEDAATYTEAGKKLEGLVDG